MFAKPFRVKSKTAMKSSEMRELQAELVMTLPSLAPNELNELIPGDEPIITVQLEVHKRNTVTVFMIQGNPILFQVDKHLYPTVYTLWRYPHLLPTFLTWPIILERIVKGADLMLPGVVIPPDGLPSVQKEDTCAIALLENRAPVAVGIALMPTSRMLSTQLQGRGISVLHAYQDFLCPEGQQIDIKKTSYKKMSTFLHEMQEENILEVRELSRGVQSIVAINWKHPKILPYIKEEATSSFQPMHTGSRDHSYKAPDIRYLYYAPASMNLLFQECGHKKGSPLDASDIRNVIIDHAKRNHLFDANERNSVNLDAVLSDCILEKNEQTKIKKLSLDNLLSRCFEKMQPAYQITFPGQEPIVRRGEISPISITLAKKALDKKVTVVQNLEAYGLNPRSVASILRQRCHASASVSRVPGTKNNLELQIQGNQIQQLHQLLLQEYHLPQKSVESGPRSSRMGRK
ncbi:eukaryotic translation initiation factor 2D-like [Sorex araneus]|uniref:eukaryotic translation initiation factor 2D-like n=1 Tax=Sorex araneus TaxID=42254 RepID=UPI0003316129|nr:eukaryotic translation initiation factor 2D-like [Sorex araneus]